MLIISTEKNSIYTVLVVSARKLLSTCIKIAAPRARLGKIPSSEPSFCQVTFIRIKGKNRSRYLLLLLYNRPYFRVNNEQGKKRAKRER